MVVPRHGMTESYAFWDRSRTPIRSRWCRISLLLVCLGGFLLSWGLYLYIIIHSYVALAYIGGWRVNVHSFEYISPILGKSYLYLARLIRRLRRYIW